MAFGYASRGFLLALCWLIARVRPAWGQQWGVRPDGTAPATLAPQGTRAVVLFFVATDCPISNRSFPEMQKLRQEFSARSVRVWFVYPNTGESAGAVVAHQKQLDPGGEALLDPSGDLVRLAHAVATPEIAVLVPEAAGHWRSVYSGRLDDRYVRLGLERPVVREHFGEEAIAAVLEGRQPKPPVGAPVGCAIMNPGAP